MSCECCKRDIEIKARGLCAACYQRWNKTGSTEYQRIGKVTLCHVKDCGKRAISKGLCDKHRKRLARHGHLENTRPEYWGSKEKHPMYHAWNHIRRFAKRGEISEEWGDFFQFVVDVGERPSPKYKLYRADETKKYSKDNFIWKRSITERHKDEDKKTYEARRMRVYRSVSKEAVKATELKSRYGLVESEYRQMIASCDNRCGICGNKEVAIGVGGKVLALAIDHCHDTGKVRGLLCVNCNKGLGHFKDSVDVLKSAISYLEK